MPTFTLEIDSEWTLAAVANGTETITIPDGTAFYHAIRVDDQRPLPEYQRFEHHNGRAGISFGLTDGDRLWLATRSSPARTTMERPAGSGPADQALSVAQQARDDVAALAPNVRKITTDAGRAPLPTDDETQGYAVGSRWIYNGREWFRTSAGEWNPAGDLTPEAFGAVGNGTSDDTAALNAWAGWPGEKRVLPEREYRITSLAIPAGSVTTGTLRLVTSQPTGTVLTIGENARIEAIHIRHDGSVPATVSATIGAGFQCSLFRAEAAVETGHDFLTIDNTGARVDRMEFRNFARPLVLGLGGTSATVGGRFRSIIIDRFIRGVAANRADGWTIDRLDIRGRSPNTSKSPGRNGILISGCSDWTIGDLNVDGAGEHAFRVGGSIYGGESSRWKIGRFTARDTGGCVFKLADDIATTRGWEVGSIYALGSLGEAPGRNSELMRISYAANGYIGTATARRESGTFSVFGGLHVANVEDIHVGEMDIAHYAAEALAVRDQDSVVNATAKNVTVGYLRAVGSVGNLVAFGNGTGQIDGIRIGDGYFDTDAPNLIASGADSVISRPVEVGGYLKNGSTSITAAAAANAVLNIRRASDGAALLGRGAAQGGDVGVLCRPFDPGNVAPEQWGGVHIEARGVSPADGAFGAGVNFSRPGSPGRRGAAIVPYQDGAEENKVGLRLMAGSGSTSTNALLSQWNLRASGDLDFNIMGRGPVVLSPNGSRWRLTASNAGDPIFVPA